MSTIIEFIITFVLYFLVALAAALPLAIFHTRKMDKLMSNYFREIDESCAALNESQNESCAARLQNLKEVHAQVDELVKPADEIHKDIGEMHEDIGEMHEDIGEIHEDIDEIHESSDEKDEYLEGLIEFTRIMRDYSDYKTKRIEARENFCESQFWDEKNIH